MGKFDGGVMLTFRSLVNQGYDVDDCKQEETSGVWGYLKNRLTGFSLHFSLFSCGQACYTFAKLPADVDEADCGLTVSVSSTGGKCAYSGKWFLASFLATGAHGPLLAKNSWLVDTWPRDISLIQHDGKTFIVSCLELRFVSCMQTAYIFLNGLNFLLSFII